MLRSLIRLVRYGCSRRPLPPRVANALYDAAQVTNIVATLGIAHRVSGPVNAALQLWTLSYRNSWGMILHNDNMALMHQLVLGVTPSADALSVDALVRDKALTPRRFDRDSRRDPHGHEYCNLCRLCDFRGGQSPEPHGFGNGPPVTRCAIKSQPMPYAKKSSVPRHRKLLDASITLAVSSLWRGSVHWSLSLGHRYRWSTGGGVKFSPLQHGACIWEFGTSWGSSSRTTRPGYCMCRIFRLGHNSPE